MAWNPKSAGSSVGTLITALNAYMRELDAERAEAAQMRQSLAEDVATNQAALEAAATGPMQLRVRAVRNTDVALEPEDELLFVTNTSGAPLEIQLTKVTREENGRIAIIFPWLCDGTNTIVVRAAPDNLIDESDSYEITVPLRPLVLMEYAQLNPNRWVPLLTPNFLVPPA